MNAEKKKNDELQKELTDADLAQVAGGGDDFLGIRPDFLSKGLPDSPNPTSIGGGVVRQETG